MDTWKASPELNEDDRTARRIVSLAIAFSNARRPISTKDVWRDLYPDFNRESFKKAYLRDRERLALAGLVIRQQPSAEGSSCWFVDEGASFVKENSLSQEDALLLDFLLLPLARDPDIPYARDLQLALTKIDRSFDGTAEVALPPSARTRNKSLSTLETALVQRRAVEISYRRADNTKLKRLIAPFGLFSFRSQPYVVAAPIDELNVVHSDIPHTYNISRMDKVTPKPKISYKVPSDFDVRDFLKLPFQMGQASCVGTFVDKRDRHERTEEIFDIGLAASWALAKGLCPTSPDDLVAEWNTRIIRAHAFLAHWREYLEEYNRIILANTPTPISNRRKKNPRKAGRPRNTEKIRELVSLIGSLSMTGDTITLEAVSNRLGMSPEDARVVMEIVCEAGGEETGGLLISCNDDETEYTLQYPGTHGRPIKLTTSETVAVLRALDAVGIADDDPLRTKLSATLTSPEVQVDEVRRALGAPSSSEVLESCARAQAQGKSLHFMYRGLKDAKPRMRRVAIRSLIPQKDIWHIRAYDLDIEQERTFRSDRMTDVTLGKPVSLPDITDVAQPCVNVVFASHAYFDMYEWHDIRNVREHNGIIHAELPYYGPVSTWLLRRIIACDGTLIVEDEGIMTAAQEYARNLLKQL